MLVLSRKTDEGITLRVGDIEIKLLVLEAKPWKCRLGITAPMDVVVVRDEILEKGPWEDRRGPTNDVT